MTEFEKSIFAESDSMYRVKIYLCKTVELIEMANLMTDEDKKNLKKVCDMMGYDTFEDWRRANDA